MLPQNAISNPPVPAPFLPPDDVDFHTAISYELGGVALNDASQGRMVQLWAARIDGQAVKLAPQGGADTTVFTVAGALSTVSLGFDSNMQPTVAYTEDGLVKLYWFDTVAGQFVHTSFPAVTSPKVCTDDKRDSQVAASDVIFAYVRDDVVRWRQQRDRYTVEYTAGPALGYQLHRLGMTENRRVQFELRAPR